MRRNYESRFFITLCFVSVVFIFRLDDIQASSGIRAKYPNILYQGNNYTLEIELYNTFSPDVDDDGYIDVTPSFQDLMEKGWKHWVYQEPGHIEIANQEVTSAVFFAVKVWSLCLINAVDLFEVPPYIQDDLTISYRNDMAEHLASVRQSLLSSQDICDNTAITIEILAADTLGALRSTISMVTGLTSGSYEHQVANTLIKAYGVFFSTQETLESYRELLTSYGILGNNENIPPAPILMERIQTKDFAGSSAFWKAMTEKYIDVTGDGDQVLTSNYWDSTWGIVKNEIEGAIVTAAAYSSEAYFLYGLTAKTSLGAGLSAAVDGVFSVSNLTHLLSVGVTSYSLNYLIDDGTYWRDKCAAINYLVTDENNGLVDLAHQSAINLTSYAPFIPATNINAEDALAVFYGYGITLAFEKRLAYLEMQHAQWIEKTLLASILYLLTGGLDFSNDSPSSIFADEYHKLKDFIDAFYEFTTKPKVFIDGIYPESLMDGGIVNFKGHGFDLDGWIANTEWRLFTAPYAVLTEDQEVSTLWLWGSGNVRVGIDVEDNEGNKDTATQLLYINQASPSNAPQISPSLPTIYLLPGSSDTSIDLDDYVQDPDHSYSQLGWSYSGNVNVQLSIDPVTHILTINAPEGWRSLEIINLTVKDPSNLGDSGTLFIIINDIVQLLEGTVTPSSGDINDEFVYSVLFNNTKGESPTNYKIYIDDEPYSMTPGTGDLFTGKTYTYTKNLSSGSHNYYFVFSTSDGIYRFPESGSLSGPTITTSSGLLSNGYVTPTSGIETTEYTYYTTYKNPSGQAPKYVFATIDDGHASYLMHKVSGDFISGAVYKCSTATLSKGQHNYYFTARLQDDSLVTSNSKVGPSVAEAGQLQVSIVPRKPWNEYEVGEYAWLDIEIKDPAGNYVDPDGDYPIQVCQTPPELYYGPIYKVDVGRYEVQTTSLRTGYTTITCMVQKSGYKTVSVAIQYIFGDVGELDPVEISNVEMNPPSINPGVTDVNVLYSISKDSLITIRIADSSNEIIRTLISHVQKSQGTHIEQWDGKNDGSNFVSDGLYHIKIEAINLESIETISVFAPLGRGYGELFEPKGIWAYDDKIYVVDGYVSYQDTWKGSIFRKNTSHVSEFDDNISWPKGIALNSNGTIFVVSSRWTDVDPTVNVYDNSGTYQRSFGGSSMVFSDNPCISVDGEDDIYIGSGQIVYKFSQSGSLLHSFSVTGLNQYDNITGIAVDEEGNIWTSSVDASLNNSIIKKFAQNGSELHSFTASNGGTGLSVRGDGLIFSKGQYQIRVYDNDGTLLHSANCGDGGLSERGIFVDNDGYIYTACMSNFSLVILRDLSTKATRIEPIIADSNPPMATISSPSAGQLFDGHVSLSLSIYGTANDSQFSHYLLEWSDDGSANSWHLINRGDTPVESSLLGTWVLENMVSGNYFVRLSVYDETGTISEAQVDVNYLDATPPSASIVNTSGEILNNIVVVGGVSSDDDINYVDFEYQEEGGNTWNLIGRDYANTYSVNWDTRVLSFGEYLLRAVATDTADNKDLSPMVISLVIDNLAPTANISNLTDGCYVNGIVTIEAHCPDSDIDSIHFQYREKGRLSWTNINPTDIISPWMVVWNTANLIDSLRYELRAVAGDKTGNIDGNPVFITVTIGSNPGDIDGNTIVNLHDFARLAEFWGQNEPSVDIAPVPAGDGIIDILDLMLLTDHWLEGARLILQADLTGDGVVDFRDFAEVAKFWLEDEPSVDIAPFPDVMD